MLHQMFSAIRNKQQLRKWAESWTFVKEVMRDWWDGEVEKFRLNKKDNRQMVEKGGTIDITTNFRSAKELNYGSGWKQFVLAYQKTE